MDQSSPWTVWDPSQLGSLRFRLDRGKQILPEDLAKIVEGDETCVPDPLLREYLLRALRGDLRRPRGRPQGSIPAVMLTAADVMIDMVAEDIRAKIAAKERKRVRGDREPKAEAANLVVKMFGNITGRSLRNQISVMKKQAFEVKEKPNR